MKKILISWIATTNDFQKNENDSKEKEVNLAGPNSMVHRLFWENYDKHILLSSSSERSGDLLMNKLQPALTQEFKHTIEPKFMDITDVIDLMEIIGKVQTLLEKYRNDEVHIFISPGTPAMQTAWYLCKAKMSLSNHQLFQMRRAKDGKSGIPEKVKIELEEGFTSLGLNIREIPELPEQKEICETESWKKVVALADKVALTDDVTTLIIGESGTGKEILARYIHQKSVTRSKRNLVVLNCIGIQDQQIEERLFGKDKKNGLIEEAKSGTIILDEIGEISPYMQQLLLRLLSEKEFTPIGKSQSVKANVRLIATTRHDLYKRCQEGLFRWDLYYRLSIAEIILPTLIERGVQEVEELLAFFIRQKKQKFRKNIILKLSKEVKSVVLQHDFRGNVRELEHLVENLYVFADTSMQIELKDLPERITKRTDEENSFDWGTVEKQHILKVYQYFNQNIEQTTKALGWNRNTLKSRLKVYGMI